MTQVTPEMTFESQDPAIQAAVDSARDLAKYATLALNYQVGAAESQASVVSKLDEYDAGNAGSHHEQEFTRAGEDFARYRAMAEAVMPPRSAFEAPKIEAPEGFARSEVWEAMNRQEQAFTLEVRTAILTGGPKELGITADRIGVVRTAKGRIAVIDRGSIDLGNPEAEFDPVRSPRAIMSPKNDALFQIKVGGATYDGRKDVTDDVYDAKVEDARARGVLLPDSKPLADETGDVWTWTFLSGEEQTAGGFVQIRLVNGGEVYRDVATPGGVNRHVRAGFAVVAPDFSSEV